MKLEICTASVDDCITAQQGGAARVELNTALTLGGLTPSVGLIREAVSSVSIPVIVMIRPRDGGFCYTPAEFRTMQHDIDAALESGAAGVAFGILTEEGIIDIKRNKILIEQTGEKEAVMHRACDLTPDPLAVLNTCIDLGFTRILTSGQEKTALEGADLLKKLIGIANNQIEILPGSGIIRDTVRDVIKKTGCTQIHCSLTTLGSDSSGTGASKIDFRSYASLPLDGYKKTDLAGVQEMVDILKTGPETGDSYHE